MATVTFKKIVYLHSGTGVRHHHYSSSEGIISGPVNSNYPGTTDTTSGTYSADGAAQEIYNGQLVNFAFMAVKGSADGNQLFTSAGDQSIRVGSNNVTVLVVYAPPGGIGVNGGPGVWVDAFNVDTCAFSDDLHFIQVFTPPTPPDNLDAAKTDFANMEGEISTVTAEHMRASTTVDGAIPFLEWKQVTSNDSPVGSRDVDLAQGQSGQIWFAFYKTPPAPPAPSIPHFNDRLGWIYLSPGVLVGGGGFGIGPDGKPHPIDPDGPLMQQLLSTFAMISVSANMHEKLQMEARRIASDNLRMIADSVQNKRLK
ncbi:MAG TPA: hypothetical protein PK511_07030 [Chitinophagales bacterium]|nr:hypothetical protein [Chitinophagales bacterium]HMU69515.1 hypothetical protein [Chitinophagales bacterium]HMZ89233.1 hypothetical protein [Chitinophagales bacterium]HNA59361.1 hypothetical protein [Chitinophagales bacterium]HNE45704.1 hypothetical protein [Chitinophagales bacterium]